MNPRKRSQYFAFLTVFAFALSSIFTFAAAAEFGKATYYNNKYHGKKTASGELYDKDALTCAHKSLPFGTIVRVTRLDNEVSVDVKVNDRGPYTEGFVVDVSYRAAEILDLIKAGSAKVKVEVVDKPEPAANRNQAAPVVYGGGYGSGSGGGAVAAKPAVKTATPAPAAPVQEGSAPELYQIDLKSITQSGFGIQVATLTNSENALREAAKLQKIWPGKVLMLAGPSKNDPASAEFKLLVGPFPEKTTAEAQQKIVAKKGYSKCFVVDLNSL